MNVGGRLLVRVTEFGTQPAAGLPYGLGLEVSDAPNLACVDDRFDTWTGTTSSGAGTAATTIRFTNDDEQVRPMGRDTAGVRGMKLRPSDEVVAADIADVYDAVATPGHPVEPYLVGQLLGRWAT